MKTILITGANGFVGQHLARELSQNGYRVVGVGGQQGSAEPVPEIDQYLVVDLNDSQAVQQIDFSDVHAIIHLAGLAAVGPSFDDPLLYIQTNIGIEINLFEAALQQNAHPKVLVISSGSLYDPTAPLPLAETSTALPNSPYAVSKLGQEQMAQYYAGRGFEVVIARPFNHIGPGQNPGFIVPDLTKQVIDFEKGVSQEVLVGNLDAKRDYTDVRDIARAYRLLIEKGISGETYNICSGTPRAGTEILDAILAASSAQPAIKQDPAKMRPSDAPEIYGSHAKITADTGWEPQISFEQTIADVLADWRSRT